MAPLQHGDLFKDCMVQTVKTLFPEKADTLRTVEQVPLSRNTCTRRVEDIANHLTNTIVDNLKTCESFSVALDETNDINDTAQLSVFTRYFLDGSFHEDLLGVICLEGLTTGAIIYDGFQRYMEQKDIPLNKIIGLATDGAPAMVGKNNGFLKHIRDANPDIIAFHCIIHESVLCSKLRDYSELMTSIMKMINYLKSQSGLRHRQMRKFLKENNAECDDLLTHNNVR